MILHKVYKSADVDVADLDHLRQDKTLLASKQGECLDGGAVRGWGLVLESVTQKRTFSASVKAESIFQRLRRTRYFESNKEIR